MGLIWAAIIGLVVGALAKLIMPGNQGGGIIVTALLGIVGALVATWIGRAVGWYGPDAGAGLIASVIGAILVLWVYGLIVFRKRA